MARTMKRHDTIDPITGTVTANGTAVDLRGTADGGVYSTVKFFAKSTSGTAWFGGTVSSAGTAGDWTYTQTDADVSVADTYECEIEATLPNGKKIHFPNDKADNELLTITEDVDDL